DLVRMSQQPFVSGGAHRERADLLDELGEARFAERAECEQPLERIVLGGDEAVERGGGVVLGAHVRWSVVGWRWKLAASRWSLENGRWSVDGRWRFPGARSRLARARPAI